MSEDRITQLANAGMHFSPAPPQQAQVDMINGLSETEFQNLLTLAAEMGSSTSSTFLSFNLGEQKRSFHEPQ
jgi:hypothetical protein